MSLNSKDVSNFTYQIKKQETGLIRNKNVLIGGAAIHYMVPGAWVFDSERT